MNPNSHLEQLSNDIADRVQTASKSLAGLARGGTATAWDADGHYVTTASAVRGRPTVALVVQGARRRATVVGVDPGTDLAVLKVDGPPSEPLPWEPELPRVGSLVLVTGRGRRGVYTSLGTVSATAGAWRTPSGSVVDAFVDVDASLPRGFSGGPLIDTSGAVLGINTRGLVRGGTTLPTRTVQRVVKELLEHGSVQRGYLGVGMQPVELPTPVEGHESGLLLTWVDPAGPAQAAGLFIGDLLVELAGEPVRDANEVAAHLGASAIDTELALRFVRAGALHEGSIRVTRKT